MQIFFLEYSEIRIFSTKFEKFAHISHVRGIVSENMAACGHNFRGTIFKIDREIIKIFENQFSSFVCYTQIYGYDNASRFADIKLENLRPSPNYPTSIIFGKTRYSVREILFQSRKNTVLKTKKLLSKVLWREFVQFHSFITQKKKKKKKKPAPPPLVLPKACGKEGSKLECFPFFQKQTILQQNIT